MTLRILPDVEQLVTDYLLTVDEVETLVGSNVGSRLSGLPAIVVSRIGGSPDPIPLHIDRARIQIDAWTESEENGGSKGLAHDIAATTLAALVEMVNVDHAAGVVCDVEPVLGPLWQPDPTTHRPRYVVDVIVVVHPVPSS